MMIFKFFCKKKKKKKLAARKPKYRVNTKKNKIIKKKKQEKKGVRIWSKEQADPHKSHSNNRALYQNRETL